ncbi:MAG TPA: hypothetical protein PK177_13975 [Burkholderiaceae bacterium]|nr:hypothetical protein [Burkholderiaceae bacterium]
MIYGPQGCGKTRNAAALAQHFGCEKVVDDWDGTQMLTGSTLALTNVEPGLIDPTYDRIAFSAVPIPAEPRSSEPALTRSEVLELIEERLREERERARRGALR